MARVSDEVQQTDEAAARTRSWEDEAAAEETALIKRDCPRLADEETVQIVVHLPVALYDRLAKRAAQEHKTMPQVAHDALEYYLAS